MYFQLHGTRKQSLENRSPLKKLFYLFSCFDRKAQNIRYYYVIIRIWGRHDHNEIKTTFVIYTLYICIYIYIYIIHLFHALHISAIPRNKVANSKKKNQTRNKAKHLWNLGKNCRWEHFPLAYYCFFCPIIFRATVI